jgi:drug/metabolite transporter (DMT)-like permease
MPDAGPFGPATVVVLGLLSALSFGSSDFGAGLTSRRVPVLGVALAVQIVGAAIALAAALAVSEPPPDAGALGLGIGAGLCGVAGILCLYSGLAVGRMGVVAPVTGVLGAALPVVVALVFEGVPAPGVSLGMALALVAVVIVSRAPAVGGRRSGIELALVAGAFIGLFNVIIGRLPEGVVWWPLLALKLAAAALILLVALLGRRPWRVAPRMIPAAAGVGLGDMAGNALYVLATQTGRLDVAAVLSSLYPVVTVILAILILREHVGRQHAFGIGLAALGIALIAAGS